MLPRWVRKETICGASGLFEALRVGMCSHAADVRACFDALLQQQKYTHRSLLRELENVRSRLKQSEDEKRAFESKYLQAQVHFTSPSIRVQSEFHCILLDICAFCPSV
jgi:hypothetical protein